MKYQVAKIRKIVKSLILKFFFLFCFVLKLSQTSKSNIYAIHIYEVKLKLSLNHMVL